MTNSLIFTGAMTYGANYEAMEFFLQDVYPLVKARQPGVTLRITGSTQGVPLRRLPLDESVLLTGYVDDVRPLIWDSAVCVAPLRVGGGTRLKILEAMALGRPVVATSKGAEGLEVTHGYDILIADDPATFADCILRLLADPSLRERLAQAARQTVEEKYDWRIIGRRLDALLRDVVQQAGVRYVG